MKERLRLSLLAITTIIFLVSLPVMVFSDGNWIKCDSSHKCQEYSGFVCCPDDYTWKSSSSCSECGVAPYTPPTCGWPESNEANYTKARAWCVDSTPGNDAYNKRDWSVEVDWKAGDESPSLQYSDTTCEGPHWMNATSQHCIQEEDDDPSGGDDNVDPQSPGGHWNTHDPLTTQSPHYSNPSSCSFPSCGTALSSFDMSHQPDWASDKNNYWHSSWTVSDPKFSPDPMTLTDYMLYFVDWDYEIDVRGQVHTPTEDDYVFCTGLNGENPSEIVDTTNPDMENTDLEGSYIAWVKSGETTTQPGDYDSHGQWGCCGDDPDEWFTGRVCNEDNVWCKNPDPPESCVEYTTSA